MRRPSSPAQLALIDLPVPASSRAPRARRSVTAAWREAQAAANARSSEVLLAQLQHVTPSPVPVAPPAVASRPVAAPAPLHLAVVGRLSERPSGVSAPSAPPVQWRAEALAELFEAIERAGQGESNTVRRAAG